MGSYFFHYLRITHTTIMSAVAKPKVAKKPAVHPTYQVMVCNAIVALKSRGGSSRQAIAKHIADNNKGITGLTQHLRKALTTGVEKGWLARTKGVGASGSFKVVKVAAPKKKKVIKKKPAPKKKKAAPKKKKKNRPQKKKKPPQKKKKKKKKKS